MGSVHTVEYYSTLKRQEILAHTTTGMDLEDIMLSEKKPVRNGQTLYDYIYMRHLE